VNKHLTKIGKELKSLVSLLKIPIFMAGIFIELAILLPYFITLIAQNRALGIIGLIVSQSPLIYYILKDFLRRTNLVMDERGETRDTTTIEKTLEEYVEMIEKQGCHVKH